MKDTLDRQTGLYRSEYEHDACGVGMVADIGNRPSHDIVLKGLTVLKRLMHRGATGNDPLTGDGAGLLMRIPDAFFRKTIKNLPPTGAYGIAMIFGGIGDEKKIEDEIYAEGARILTWRDVPVNPDAIGPDARLVMPRIRQIVITANTTSSKLSLEQRLFVIRRRIEKDVSDAYICSCSSKTIVYKGLLLATQIEAFYPDLTDEDFVSPFAIVHQRYSTNTSQAGRSRIPSVRSPITARSMRSRAI